MSVVTYDVSQEFPFDKLSLENPHGVQGGAYFSKIKINGGPFLFQTPKCSTKAGIVTTEKKIYCDLILTSDNDIFIQFLQELEKSVQSLIYEKRNIWFHNDMEMENIEYFFNPVVRTYKKNFLVRTYIQQPKHIKSAKSLQIYDENENRLAIQDVKKNNKVIAILEGLGIKFTSSSFHLELCLRQAMVLEDKPIFQKCLIQMRKPVKNEKITLTHKAEDNHNLYSPADQASENPDPSTNKEEGEEKELEGHIETDKDSDSDNDNTDIVSTADDPPLKDDAKAEPIPVTHQKDSPITEKTVEDDKHLEQNKELCEINVDISGNVDAVQLKAPLTVYREIYKKAKEKARMARRLAIQAFLEAKKIKNTFLIGEVEESDDDDLDPLIELSKE
jgi:hypothetical protein